MPTLREAASALVAQALSLETGVGEFALLPTFNWPIDQGDLQLSDPAVDAAFSRIVNMVPTSAGYNLDGHFTWDVLREVLRPENLVVASGAASIGRLILDKLSDGERIAPFPDLAGYLHTGVLRDDLNDGWRQFTLEPSSVKELAGSIPAQLREQLMRCDFLDTRTGSDLVRRVTGELLVIPLMRDWHAPELFKSRDWSLRDGIVSDGGAIPKGKLPGVVEKLVLARDVSIELAPEIMQNVASPQATPEPQLSYVWVAGQSRVTETGVLEWVPGHWERRRASDPAPPGAVDTGVVVVRDHRTGPVAHQMALNTMLMRISGASGSGSRESIVRRLRLKTGNMQERFAALTAEVGGSALVHEADDPELAVEAVAATAPAHGILRFHLPFNFDTREARAWLRRLVIHDADVHGLQRRDVALDLLEHFDRKSVHAPPNQAFVLGVICKSTPKSPDPDPALSWPA